MTLQFLVDTDWVIDHLNEVDRVVEKLKELRPQGLAVSIVPLAELYEGVYSPGSRSRARRPWMPFWRRWRCWASTKKSVGASGRSAAGCDRKASSSAISISSLVRPRYSMT